MTRAALALSAPTFRDLVGSLDEEYEAAGVLHARIMGDPEGLTVFGREMYWAPADTYVARQRDQLTLGSEGWVPALRAAGKLGHSAIFVHSHPGGRPEFSSRDDRVDEVLAPIFRDHTAEGTYVSLVVAGSVDAPQVVGRFVERNGTTGAFDIVRVVGDRLDVTMAHGNSETRVAFDRQIRAFGADGQATLAALRTGVVGAGGTGSAVCEQLLRLGVGELVVIDDDDMSETSITRGYGSAQHDVGRPKVDVIVDLADSIDLGTKVVAVKGNLARPDIALSLRHCDIVFCCADGHSARVVLNRYAYAHLSPVIDLAVLVSGHGDTVGGIDGRVTWVAPEAACLLCRARIDPSLAATEHLDPAERHRLAAQGYVPELEDPQPSVITYTTTMAGLAVTELLNRLFGLADLAATEVVLRFHERELRGNRLRSRPGCFCAIPLTWPTPTDEPYLGLTWKH